jgi:hypothetical protein
VLTPRLRGCPVGELKNRSVIKASRVLAGGVFAIAVAVMPLGALFSNGVFETWVGGDEYRPRVRAILQDETGLVRAVIGHSDNADGPYGRLALGVPIWGGCGARVVHLTFRDTGNEYEINQRNDESGCSFLNLVGYGRITILLWAPVDDPVRLDSRFGSSPP